MLSSGADGWAHSAVRTAGTRAAPAPSSGMHIAHIVKISVPRSRCSNGDAQPPEPLCQRQQLRGGSLAAAGRAPLAATEPLRATARLKDGARSVAESVVLHRRRKSACSASSTPPSETRGRAAGAAAAAVESVLSSGLCAASLAAADAAPLGGRALLRRCGLLTPRRRASPGAARPGAHRALHRSSARKIAQRRRGSVRRRCTCGPDQNLQLAAGPE